MPEDYVRDIKIILPKEEEEEKGIKGGDSFGKRETGHRQSERN